MAKLALRHQNHIVGYAQIDDEFLYLSAFYWGLMVPDRTRLVYQNQLTLVLRDDDGVRTRCHPFTQLSHNRRKIILRLAVIPIRPQIASLAIEFLHEPNDQRKSLLLNEIHNLMSTTRRLLWLNNDRTDCRSLNVRESGTRLQEIEDA